MKVDLLKLNPDDISATIFYKDGKKRKEEFYNGSSFLSQSAKFIELVSSIRKICIFNSKGKMHVVNSN